MRQGYHWWERSARSALVRVFCVITMAHTGISGHAQSTPAPYATKTVSPHGVVNPDGTIATDRGLACAVDLRGWDVTLDSQRGPVLRPKHRAMGSTLAPGWSALANQGLNEYVCALAVVGSDLYVGGYFTQTYDGSVKNLNYIAKYSGGTWSALANNGLDNAVHALAVAGSDLYVGGAFSQTYDGSVSDLNGIAKYSTGTGSWSALANQGLGGGAVFALAVSGSDLYVGGNFTDTHDWSVELNNIAKYSGGTWSALANRGLDAHVIALAVVGGDVYVGGIFTQTYDGSVGNLNNIAKYSASKWSALANHGLDNIVLSLAVVGSDLHVGGDFRQTADGSVTNLNYIAKYSTGTWSALANKGLDGHVHALAVVGSDLYVGGGSGHTADGSVGNLNEIAKYSGGTWSALANQGLSPQPVNVLAASGSDLYVGGDFMRTYDWNVVNLNHIAKYSTSSCSAPSITTQPASQTIGTGSQATLTVISSGDEPFHYQWYQGATGATTTPVGTDSSSFTTPALTANAQYWVRVTNACGQADSNTATITVVAGCVAPSIATHPQSQTITRGSTATLTVITTGDAPMHYQWYQGATGDTSNPVGTNSNSYAASPLTTTSFWVHVSNGCGQADSNAAVITVNFASGVVITGIRSKKSTPNSPAKIKGTGFVTDKKKVTVKFGTLKATVIKATTTAITVKIPKRCKKGTTYQVVVTISGKGASNPWPFTVK
ncbi:MAG: IPT/TIG domain-containing protein [Acidobacteriota bacterium]